MPDPDRASRIASPYFADVSRGGKAESLILDPKLSQGCPPLRHARPRSGIQDSKSLFCRCVKGRKSGIIDTGSKAFARMTWNWLSADAEKRPHFSRMLACQARQRGATRAPIPIILFHHIVLNCSGQKGADVVKRCF